MPFPLAALVSLLPTILDLIFKVERRYKGAGKGARKKAAVMKAVARDVGAAVTAARDAGLLKDKDLKPHVEAVTTVVDAAVDLAVGVLNAKDAFGHDQG